MADAVDVVARMEPCIVRCCFVDGYILKKADLVDADDVYAMKGLR